MANVHKGHRERVRQKYIKDGLDGFYDHEVLELLLFQYIPYRDVNIVAHQLIDTFGSLAGVLDAPPELLMTVKGVSEATAVNLSVLKDVWYRYRKSLAENQKFSSLADVVQYAREVLSAGGYERLLVVYVDSATKFLGKRIYCSNDNTTVYLPVKKIVTDAVACSATGMMIFHGHVRGVAKPSLNDVRYTEQLFYTLSGIGIALLEHGIFNSEGEYYSFRQSGLLAEYAAKYEKIK